MNIGGTKHPMLRNNVSTKFIRPAGTCELFFHLFSYFQMSLRDKSEIESRQGRMKIIIIDKIIHLKKEERKITWDIPM